MGFFPSFHPLQLSKQKSEFVCIHSDIHSSLWRNGVALLSPLLLLSALILFLMSLGVRFLFLILSDYYRRAPCFYWGSILAIHLNIALQYHSPSLCKRAKWICQGLLEALGERRITYGSQPTAVSLRNWSCSAVSE